MIYETKGGIHRRFTDSPDRSLAFTEDLQIALTEAGGVTPGFSEGIIKYLTPAPPAGNNPLNDISDNSSPIPPNCAPAELKTRISEIKRNNREKFIF